MIQGTKSQFFTDVKLPIIAGIEFCYPNTKNNKMRKVGYEVYRNYFDSEKKDWQIGSERIKRVINNS